MRNAFAWFGCLVPIVLVGCTASAPPAAETSARVAPAGCVGTACAVILREDGGVCSVDPPSLAIDSGDTVTFETQVSSQTAVVVITPKATSGITFQHGPPTMIPRGGRHASGSATGSPGAEYTYNARFVTKGGQNVCPLIDPVICIKPGGMEQGEDTCE